MEIFLILVGTIFIVLLLIIASFEQNKKHQNKKQYWVHGKAKVIDGDGILIGKRNIRLHGIDALEYDQPNASDYKNALKEKIEGKKIKCDIHCKDKYERSIATCYLNDLNINQWMVRNGLAVAYHSSKYKQQEELAKKEKIGIWSHKFTPPHEWRERKNSFLGLTKKEQYYIRRFIRRFLFGRRRFPFIGIF